MQQPLMSTKTAEPLPHCGESCYSAISALNFNDCRAASHDHASYFGCVCNFKPFLQSVGLCVEDHCSRAESAFQTPTAQMCWEHSGITVPTLEDVLQGARLDVIPYPSNTTDLLLQPIVVADDIFRPLYQSSYAFRHSLEVAVGTGLFLVVLTIAACLFAGLTRFWPKGVPKVTSTIISKHLMTPALIRKNALKGRIGRFTLSYPNRLQTLLIAVYLIINILGLFVNLNLFKENVFWPNDIFGQAIRYISDRAGILAITNMPLMIAFGGRNHLLMWLSGSRFDNFNVFHKWIGRIVVFHSLIHTIGYVIMFIIAGGWKHLIERMLDRGYLQFGLLAFLAGVIICIQGAHYFRRWAYEVFLYLHIGLSIAFLVGVWYHIGLLKLHGYMPWIYASCLLWIFDRFIRLGRLVYCNIAWARKTGFSTSQASLSTCGDYIQVSITPARHWRFKPGQYIYLHLLNSRMWESHPFSIVAYKSCSSVEEQHDKGSANAEEEIKSLLPMTEERLIILYIRPYDSMTRRLASLASSGSTAPHRVLIEGPYGHQVDLTRFDKICFMAGGIGISGVYAHFEAACLKSKPCHLFWVVRDLVDVICCLEKVVHLSDLAEVTIYIRHGSRTTSSEEEIKMLKRLDESSIDVHFGVARPCCKNIIEEQGRSLQIGQELAVMCCGPPKMNDDCRASCVDLMSVDRPVYYFSENLNW